MKHLEVRKVEDSRKRRKRRVRGICVGTRPIVIADRVVGLTAVAAILAAVVGILIYMLLMRRMTGEMVLAAVLATIALGIVLRGALLGACTGAVLAGAYAAVAPLIFGALLAFTNGAMGGPLDPLIGAAVFSICAGPFGFVLGILPGTILGALAGLVIGIDLALLRDRVSPAGAAWIGLLVAGVIVAGIVAPHRLTAQRARMWVSMP